MRLLPALALAWLVPLAVSWTYSIGVDLTWPPPINSGYITIDSRLVGVNDPSPFPCHSVPLTGNEPRTIFPVMGGQFQWSVKNTSGRYAEYYFVTDMYLGQISAETQQSKGDTWAYAAAGSWQNLTTSSMCGSEIINATALVNTALRTDFADVVGMNATFGLRSVLFTHDLHYKYPEVDISNIEELYQCAYVTFVSADTPKQQFGGTCILSSTSSSSVPTSMATSSPARTTSTRVTTFTGSGTTSTLQSSRSAPPASSSLPTSSSTPGAPVSTSIGVPSNSSSKASTVGIGVGVSVGVSVALAILAFLLGRRKPKHGGTLALDFWVHGRENEDGIEKSEKGGKGKGLENPIGKGKGKGESDGSNSIHDEQLPAYDGVKSGDNQDVILKSSPMAQR